MMNSQSFKHLTIEDAKALVFIGDVHGAFDLFIEQLPSEVVIIQCGDFGVGFSKVGFVRKKLKLISQHLQKINSKLIVLRGNHDDPSYFDGSRRIQYKNLYLAKDMTLVTLRGLYRYDNMQVTTDTFDATVLCCGGSISIDRAMRTLHKSYWYNENTVIDDSLLEGIIDYCDHNIPDTVDIIALHCSPIDAFPLKLSSGFTDCLKKDIVEQTAQIRKLVLPFIARSCKYVVFGHYHTWQRTEINGVLYESLDVMQQLKYNKR